MGGHLGRVGLRDAVSRDTLSWRRPRSIRQAGIFQFRRCCSRWRRRRIAVTYFSERLRYVYEETLVLLNDDGLFSVQLELVRCVDGTKRWNLVSLSRQRSQHWKFIGVTHIFVFYQKCCDLWRRELCEGRTVRCLRTRSDARVGCCVQLNGESVKPTCICR